MKLSDASKMSRFTLLQVGESGHGKTTRSLSATRFGNVKIIDVDNKLAALRTRIPVSEQSKIDFDVPGTFDALLASIDSVRSSNEFATVILDTWSRAHDLTIEKHKASNPKLTTFSFADWGAIKQMNQMLLFKLLALPQNIIVNTHVGKDKDASDRAILTVGTSGSFGAQLPQYFNETHYLNFDMKYKVRGNKSNSIVANTSLPDSLLDSNGNFIKTDLSIFDEIAYKK